MSTLKGFFTQIDGRAATGSTVQAPSGELAVAFDVLSLTGAAGPVLAGATTWTAAVAGLVFLHADSTGCVVVSDDAATNAAAAAAGVPLHANAERVLTVRSGAQISVWLD